MLHLRVFIDVFWLKHVVISFVAVCVWNAPYQINGVCFSLKIKILTLECIFVRSLSDTWLMFALRHLVDVRSQTLG